MRIALAIGLLGALTALPAAASQLPPFQGMAGDFKVTVSVDDRGRSAVAITHASARRVDVPAPLNFIVQDALQASPARLVLRSLDHRWNSVAIVDAHTGSVVDEMMVDVAVPSPSGRFLALFPATPRWADPMGALWLVYDTAMLPLQNRMPEARTRGAAELHGGWAVYPPENIARQTYDVPLYSYYEDARRPDAATLRAIHARASPYYWLDDSTLAFVDFVDNQYVAVVIDVSPGVESSRRVVIPIIPGTIGALVLGGAYRQN